MKINRNRIIYGIIIVCLIFTALYIRRFPANFPGFVHTYAPDTLWAMMVFFLLGLIFAKWPTVRLGILTLAVAYLTEISQLYHAPWIDAIRANAIGGIVLGFGFLWSDIICYTVGIGLGMALEVTLLKELVGGAKKRRRKR